MTTRVPLLLREHIVDRLGRLGCARVRSLIEPAASCCPSFIFSAAVLAASFVALAAWSVAFFNFVGYLIALVVVLNKQLGLSFGKIVTLWQSLYGLTVTRSGLVHAVHRAARPARPTYDTLCARVRGSPMVSSDETGWKVAGLLQWLWGFATPDMTVYRIQPGRGLHAAVSPLAGELPPLLSSVLLCLHMRIFSDTRVAANLSYGKTAFVERLPG